MTIVYLNIIDTACIHDIVAITPFVLTMSNTVVFDVIITTMCIYFINHVWNFFWDQRFKVGELQVSIFFDTKV